MILPLNGLAVVAPTDLKLHILHPLPVCQLFPHTFSERRPVGQNFLALLQQFQRFRDVGGEKETVLDFKRPLVFILDLPGFLLPRH